MFIVIKDIILVFYSYKYIYLFSLNMKNVYGNYCFTNTKNLTGIITRIQTKQIPSLMSQLVPFPYCKETFTKVSLTSLKSSFKEVS